MRNGENFFRALERWFIWQNTALGDSVSKFAADDAASLLGYCRLLHIVVIEAVLFQFVQHLGVLRLVLAESDDFKIAFL